MPPERPSAAAQSRWRQGRLSNLPAQRWATLNDEQNSSLPPYCLLPTSDRWPRTAHIRTLEALFRTPWALSCGPRLLPLLTLEHLPDRLGKQRPFAWGGVWRTSAMAPLREPTLVPPVASLQQG